jgi:hypothetical protein
VFTDPLCSNRRPIVALVGFRGKVFTKSLPSNGYTHHNTDIWDTVDRLVFLNIIFSKLDPFPLSDGKERVSLVSCFNYLKLVLITG